VAGNDGSSPRADLTYNPLVPTKAGCSAVVLTGRATSVPFTAVLGGPSGQPRTTTKYPRPARSPSSQVIAAPDLALEQGVTAGAYRPELTVAKWTMRRSWHGAEGRVQVRQRTRSRGVAPLQHPQSHGETMGAVHSQPGGGDAVGRLLRSVWRYKGLIVAVVLVGALLGYGWAARQPTSYEGVARVRVADRCPPDASCIPSRHQAQQLLSSQVILERAVRLSGSRISAETLRQRLEVEVAPVAPNADVITVRVVDSTAMGAAQLANAVPAAYEQLLAQQSRRMVAQLEERLRQLKDQLEGRLAEIDSQLARNPKDPRLRAERAALAAQLSAVQEQIQITAPELINRPSLVIEPAAVPKRPSSPSPGRTTAIGILVGLLASAILVWWRTRRQGPTSPSSAPEQVAKLPSPA
jgi:capsular polysaccharide biosynthesis protein